jgi:hypothetical protein
MNRFEKISLTSNLIDGGGKVVGDAIKLWTDPAFIDISANILPGPIGTGGTKIDFSTFYQIVTGSNTVISHDDNIIDGDLWIAKNLRAGVQISGRNNAMIRSVGYDGYMSASLSKGPAGFMLFSGSVLPQYAIPVGLDRRTNYAGVGLEMHAGDGSGSFRFRADATGSFIEILVKDFLFGDINTAYISGSSGPPATLVISASNFFLSSSGDVIISGTMFATTGALGNWIIYGDRLESTNQSIQMIGGNAASGSEIIMRELPSLIPRVYVGITPSSMTGSDGWRDTSKYISSQLLLNNSFEAIPNEVSWSFINAYELSPRFTVKPASYIFAPYKIKTLIYNDGIKGVAFGTQGAGFFIKSGSGITPNEQWYNTDTLLDVKHRRITALCNYYSFSTEDNLIVCTDDGAYALYIADYPFVTPILFNNLPIEGLINRNITSIFAGYSSFDELEPNILAGTSGSGVFFLRGVSAECWSGSSGVIPYGAGIENRIVTCFDYDGQITGAADLKFPVWLDNDNVFAGTDQGIFVSSNTGSTWTSIYAASLPDYRINDVIFYGTRRTATTSATSGNIVVATKGSGVYYNANWSAVFPLWQSANGSGLTALPNNVEVTDLYTDGTKIWASTFGSGVYTSSDTGSNWLSVGPPNEYVMNFVTGAGAWYAGTYKKGVLRSTDNGITWVECNSNLSSSILAYNNSTNSLAMDFQDSILREITSSYRYLNANSASTYELSARVLAQSHLPSPSDRATIRVYQDSILLATSSINLSSVGEGTYSTPWGLVSVNFNTLSSNPLTFVLAASPRETNRIIFDEVNLLQYNYFTDVSHNGLFVFNSPQSYIQLGRGVGNLVGTIVRAGSLYVNNDSTFTSTMWVNGGISLPIGAGLSAIKWLYSNESQVPDYYGLYLASAADSNRGNSLSAGRFGNYSASGADETWYVVAGNDPNANLYYYWRIGSDSTNNTRGWIFADNGGNSTYGNYPQVEINNRGNILLTTSITKYTGRFIYDIPNSEISSPQNIFKIWDERNYSGSAGYNYPDRRAFLSYNWFGDEYYYRGTDYTHVYDRLYDTSSLGAAISVGQDGVGFYTQQSLYPVQSGPTYLASFSSSGKFNYKDGTQAAGYVLTSDADGNASWAAGGVGTNYWTASGAEIHRVGDVAVSGAFSVFNGTVSITNGNGSYFTALNLGCFSDVPSIPAWSFLTDDVVGDRLFLKSHRWGGDFYITRESAIGDISMSRFYSSDTEGTKLTLYNSQSLPRIVLDSDASSSFSSSVSMNAISIFSGSAAGYVLTSDINGNAHWGPTTSGGSSSGSFAITVDTPMATENVTITKTNAAYTARSIHCIVRGTLPVGISASVKYGATRDAAGTNLVNAFLTCSNTSSGVTATTLDNPNIPLNNYIWLVTTGSLVGAPSEVNVTVYYW